MVEWSKAPNFLQSDRGAAPGSNPQNVRISIQSITEECLQIGCTIVKCKMCIQFYMQFQNINLHIFAQSQYNKE